VAFTEISRQSSTVVRTTIQTGVTDTRNLPTTPSTGQWLVVALYTNQGIIPRSFISGANNQVTVVTCGTVTMSLLEESLSTGINAPTVFIAPYQSGMSTAINVTWSNGIASTTLGLAMMVFTGPLTGASSGYNQFRYSGPGTNGAFDGSGNDGAGFGATQASATSGVITWASSASGIPTSYDTQGEVFICATSCTSSFNVNQPRQFGLFGAGVDGSGNVTTLGQATGTVLINNATTVVSSGKGVIYSPSGNFVFTYTGTNTTLNTLTGCTTTAPTTALIPGYCQLMLSTNGTSTVTAVLPTTSLTSGTLGGFQTGNSTAYSGASTANGHVQVAITGGGTPARLDLMLGTNISGLTSVKAYGNLRISGSNIPVGGGFIYTMVPFTRTMTRTSSGNLVRASRAVRAYLWNRLAMTTTVRAGRALKSLGFNRQAKTTAVWASSVSKIANFVRVAKATRINVAKAFRTPNIFNRSAKATQVNATTITRQVNVTRTAKATVVYAIGTSKSRTLIRRAVATAVGLVRAVGITTFHPGAGTAHGAFRTASAHGRVSTASVSGDFTTASAKGKVVFKNQEG